MAGERGDQARERGGVEIMRLQRVAVEDRIAVAKIVRTRREFVA